MEGRSKVVFHLRLARDLPPEAAHELAVLAGRSRPFAAALEEETRRKPGREPARRRISADLFDAARVPRGFLVIPAGSFLMGEERVPVFLDAYLASETEFPIGAWQAYLADAGQRNPARRPAAQEEQQADLVWELLMKRPNRDELPACSRSALDARACLRWMNAKRGGAGGPLFVLPTEGMWEKAARGVDGRTWAWGDAYDVKRLNAQGNRTVVVQMESYHTNFDPVGLELGMSVFGLRHAAGNVMEWTCSRDPANTLWWAVKGGGFNADPTNCRLGGRLSCAPFHRYDCIGFRAFAVFPPD
jgi:formylglycine-generating enzyme required for sulfatase activity